MQHFCNFFPQTLYLSLSLFLVEHLGSKLAKSHQSSPLYFSHIKNNYIATTIEYEIQFKIERWRQ